MSRLGEPAEPFVERVRAVCVALPEAYEEPAWVGVRWRVRKRTVAHVFSIEVDDEVVTAVMFRSTGPEHEVLRGIGPPYYAPWKDSVMLALDDDTDWSEVAELLTESYCFSAPKKLIALLDRPDVS
ncbi:MAG: hypothetical protein QOD30_1844 [Actinomycetota bacterium]|nr:hypothetical protein [Actinomycetota bacterium]